MDLTKLVPIIPNLTENSGPNVTVSTDRSSRPDVWMAFSKGKSYDTDPNGSLAFIIEFVQPVYAEYISFGGSYITGSVVLINNAQAGFPKLVDAYKYEMEIPKELRTNIKKIEIGISGNGVYNGRRYFIVRDIQAYAPPFRSLVEIHDNLFTFNNGIMSLVKPINNITLDDYKSGIGLSDIKIEKDVTDTFKIHVLEVKS